MSISTKTAILAIALALAASPAVAQQPVTPGNSGNAHPGNGAPSTKSPGPHASLPAKAKAYGRYCQGFSKKHVAGSRGTPFSKCVTDMAKLASGKSSNPHSACRDLSKKHVAGEKGTPFSRCVVAGAKLHSDQQGEDA